MTATLAEVFQPKLLAFFLQDPERVYGVVQPRFFFASLFVRGNVAVLRRPYCEVTLPN